MVRHEMTQLFGRARVRGLAVSGRRAALTRHPERPYGPLLHSLRALPLSRLRAIARSPDRRVRVLNRAEAEPGDSRIPIEIVREGPAVARACGARGQLMRPNVFPPIESGIR